MKKSEKLELMADKLRIHSLESTTAAGSGHPTTCMSCAEIMSCLFFSGMGPHDEFILSKGHAAPILWASYAEAGIIPFKELARLRKIDSIIEGHPTPPLVKIATGSLGQGLSAGAGMALAKKLGKNNGNIYVLLGDGECSEGSVWEAANTASYYSLNNLCAIIDVNRLGQTGETMHGHDLNRYVKKFRAFGWAAVTVDGHSVTDILAALKTFKKSVKPLAIIARTFKGKGVSFLENKNGWHGKPLNKAELALALKEIGSRDIKLKSRFKLKKTSYNKFSNFETNKYKKGSMISTRQAFGKVLVNYGKYNKKAILIDAEVNNSTMTKYFYTNFPERSFQSFIAEQNMAGMAAGFSSLGYKPVAATFAAFLTRAYDFIRMSRYSKSNIIFAGSHSGISIGSDGPSQMGLEDLSMFLTIPDAVIVYPSDAVSTEKIFKEIAKFNSISYLRLTRGATPVIYNNSEKFRIGGLKVVKKSDNDKVLVISAGITLHESIKAYNLLKKNNINIRVIDIYSLQPFAGKQLIKNAVECNNKVIVVEDHYRTALGVVVSRVINKFKLLSVTAIPHSGKTSELLKKFCIDSTAIIRTVRQLL